MLKISGPIKHILRKRQISTEPFLKKLYHMYRHKLVHFFCIP